MPLHPLPPDPEPTESDLAEYVKRLSAAPINTPTGPINAANVPTQILKTWARLGWHGTNKRADPDMFRECYSPEKKYVEYRQSKQWQVIRTKVLAAANHKCAGCPKRATEVHHRDYRPRVLKGEDLTPLVPLCRGCHQKVHGADNKNDWKTSERILASLVAKEDARFNI